MDRKGIRADPDKTRAIQELDLPENVTELRRILGMANHAAGEITSTLAEVTQPLRQLLSTKRAWAWTSSQELAFGELKKALTQPTILEFYNPQAPVKVSADASSFGLGAVLLQSGSLWKPVSYASRSMSETERRYAQIEKEALAVTWACDKFSDYLLGRRFGIDTDHKPLVPLLTTKHLNHLPPRILRFRLRMARYNYTVEHVPGKLLYTADALSRAPSKGNDSLDELQYEAESYIASVISNLPSTPDCLEMYRQAQGKDLITKQVIKLCPSEWPKQPKITPSLMPYWRARSSLTVHKNILLYNDRIVIPFSL